MTRAPAQMMLRCVTTLGLVAGGCANVPKDRGFDQVQSAVSDRVSASPAWPMDEEAEQAIRDRVDAILATPMSIDDAVEVALLNSPRLRATYARIGIASADLVEAGILENPRLTLFAGFPDRPPSTTELDFGLTLNILRLLMMPVRKEIASMGLDAATLAAADEVLAAAHDARVAYLNLQAAEHITSVLHEIAVAAEASYDLASRVHAAGNLSDLDLANEQALYEFARIEFARSLAEVASRREQLNVALGLWGERTEWTIVDRLPELPADEPDLSGLEALAVRQRFDLAATAKEVEALSKALGLERRWRGVLALEFGAIAARDTDGQWVYGPELSLEIPIFNRRQAEIARIEAMLDGAQNRLSAIAVETRADVRRLLDRLYSLRYEAEHYRQTVVPLHQRITELTQQQYNYMLLDTFDLLAAKRAEIDVYRRYLDTVHEYWTTRANLERAVGGRLPQGDAPPATPSEPQQQTDHMHSHGGA